MRFYYSPPYLCRTLCCSKSNAGNLAYLCWLIFAIVCRINYAVGTDVDIVALCKAGLWCQLPNRKVCKCMDRTNLHTKMHVWLWLLTSRHWGGMPTFDLFASDGLLKYDAWGTVSSAENFVKLYRQLPNGVKLSYCWWSGSSGRTLAGRQCRSLSAFPAPGCRATSRWASGHDRATHYNSSKHLQSASEWKGKLLKALLFTPGRLYGREVKLYKTHHSRTTFGSWDVEKVHAVVARSTFRSQTAQNTPCSDHFWKLRCRKSARVARSTCRSQKCKKTDGYGALLVVQMCFRVAGARDCAPCQKLSKTWGFCSISVGHLKRICKDAGWRSTKDMFMRDVRRSGGWFPERGCILEHQICRFAKMILRDRCSTSYDLASIFVAGALL